MSFFKGWYFKLQSESQTVAFIPSVHTGQHGDSYAGIQVITNKDSYFVRYDISQFSLSNRPFCLRVGGCTFNYERITLDISEPQLKVKGSVKFGKPHRLKYDIMGPFSAVPFMECRHTVISMAHSVDGCIEICGEKYAFENASGYTEGDSGRSFPEKYMWTHCFPQIGNPDSIMLSVAEIPVLNMRFTGIIGVVRHHNLELRIATYLGARAVFIGDGAAVIQQKNYILTIRRHQSCEKELFAPVQGNMSRIIHEIPSCPVHYRLTKSGNEILDICCPNAGFEFEY